MFFDYLSLVHTEQIFAQSTVRVYKSDISSFYHNILHRVSGYPRSEPVYLYAASCRLALVHLMPPAITPWQASDAEITLTTQDFFGSGILFRLLEPVEHRLVPIKYNPPKTPRYIR